MAPQQGGEFSAFRDLPPPDSPADIAVARRRRAGGREAAETLRRARCDRGARPGARRRPWRPTAALGAPRLLRRPRGGRRLRGEAVTAYRKARCSRAVKHFPGPGHGRPGHRGGPATVGLSLSSCAPATWCPSGPRSRPGRRRWCCATRSTRWRLHDARRRSRARSRPACCGASSRSAAWRSPTTWPTRPSPRRCRSRTPPSRLSGPVRTCSGSPARRATSRPPTSPCCGPYSAADLAPASTRRSRVLITKQQYGLIR